MTKLFVSIALLLVFITPSYSAQTPWLNSNIIGAIQPNYKPSLKDDFYLNVNREWLTTTKLKPGYSSMSAFNELQDIIDARLKDIMTSPDVSGHDAEIVKRLYSLWLDWQARNDEGISDLKEQAAKITGIKTLKELTEYFKTEDSFYLGTSIANYVVGIDNKNSEAYNLEFLATSLSLGDSAEYKELTPNGERTKKMHDGIVIYMLRRLGYAEADAKKFLEQAYEFEKAIAASMMTHDELESPEAIEKLYNPISITELRLRSPAYPYADILAAHKISSRYICLEQPEWLKKLNELYTPDNLERMKSYLLCNLAGSYITITDEAAYREYQRLARERYGITDSRPDDELAVDFVHGSLPVPVSRLYVSRYVSDKAREEVKGIISDTVKYYRAMLEGEDWLSEATRQKAIEKLNAMRLNVAYPDKWRDFSGLNFPKDCTFMDAVKEMRRYKTQLYFYGRLNQNVNHDLWMDDVVVVNSYYMPSENSINIIAGILGGDFYNDSMTYEEKLGGIGMVIGHEISHAFDTSGAQFDAKGNMLNWWTDEDYAKFKARADRLIKYFSSMKVDDSGKNYNGELVQTESIADIAGIKAMLGIAEGRHNFDYDKFFRSYATIWKNIHTPERNDMLVKIDVHALAYIRVNAIVQQYKKFFDTYGITKGNKMYLAPEDNVAVW